MAVLLQNLSTAVSGRVPSVQQLDRGVIAINHADGSLYFRYDAPSGSKATSVWTSDNLSRVSQLTNDAGYITANSSVAISAPAISVPSGNLTPFSFGGTMTAAHLIHAASTPTTFPVTTIVADAHLLRAYGAQLDGVTDDLAAFQAVMASAASRMSAALAKPTVVFDLSGHTVLVSGPIVSGTNCNVSYRGSGPNTSYLLMRSGGAGAIQHGTLATPAQGYLHIEGLTITDQNASGSGSTGISAVFTTSTPFPALTMQAVTINKWTQGVAITDAPRGVHVQNVSVFGPDFAMQNAPGFAVTSTASGGGCFGYMWSNVLVANYRTGWEYSIAGALEGMVYNSCHAYNGWGMVQVRVTRANYHSLLWAFTDCDWQGYGYAFDMQLCRNVRIVGGFWIANVTTLSPPNGNSVRRFFQFLNSYDITVEEANFGVLPNAPDLQTLMYFDTNCSDVNITRCCIESFTPIAAAIEVDSISLPNQLREWRNTFVTWFGGTKFLDHGNNQCSETLLNGENSTGDGRGFYGTVYNGYYDLSLYASGTTDGSGNLTIQLPTRPGGAPFFLGGNPYISATVENTNAYIGSCSISSRTTTSVVLSFGSKTANVIVGVDIRASGI